MRAILIVLCLSGCAVVPPWWLAHKAVIVEVGIGAGVVSQVESAALNTRAVVKATKEDINGSGH